MAEETVCLIDNQKFDMLKVNWHCASNMVNKTPGCALKDSVVAAVRNTKGDR